MNAISNVSAMMDYMKFQNSKGFEQNFHQQKLDFHASYFAGQSTRYLPPPPGVQAQGGGADYHFQQREYFMAVERARDFDRNNMIFGAGVDMLVSSVLQEGMLYSPATGDEALDADLKERFCQYPDSWANDPRQCDWEGEKTFDQIMEMSFRDTVVAGDIIHLLTNKQKIQTYENHHLRNPFGVHNNKSSSRTATGIVNGVQMSNGKRVAYHVTPDVVGTYSRQRYKTRALRANDRNGHRQVIHAYDPDRFSQRRGMTAIAPIVFPTQYHDDLQFSALVNAKRQGFIAIVEEMASNAILPAGTTGSTVDGQQTSTETRDDGSLQYNDHGGPGQLYRSNIPGKTITPWSPNIPGAQFFPHANLLLQIIAVNLKLPLICLMLDASKTNFNGFRGVIDQVRPRYRMMQRNRIAQTYTPMYQWWVRGEMARDPILRKAARRSDVRILGHRFTPRAWAYLQPVQDSAADDMRVNSNQASQRRVMSERGYDIDIERAHIIEDRSKFIDAAMKAATAIVAKHPNANWQETYDRLLGGTNKPKITITGSLDPVDEAGADIQNDNQNQRPAPVPSQPRRTNPE